LLCFIIRHDYVISFWNFTLIRGGTEQLREGNVIYTQTGYFRPPSQIRSVVNYLLTAPGTAATSYTLVVRDRQNQPVPGVVLNFYGAGSSQMLTSDQDGVMVFTARHGDYKFQVLSVPEGYEVDSGFEETVQEWTTVTV